MLIEFDERFDLPVDQAYSYFKSPEDWPRLFAAFGHVTKRIDGWYCEVPRYKSFLDADELILMAKQFALPESELAALAAKMPEWRESEGGVEGGRVFGWSASNPQSKYDWYEEGGRFSGYLRLKVPHRASGWRRWLGFKPSDRVNKARKADIQASFVLDDPPTALLHEGAWQECPFTTDLQELERWKARFRSLFDSIPDDSLLTIMDLHA